jgi:hypothetical protein
MADSIVHERKCSRCGLTKPIAEFVRCASKSGGHHYECRECQKERHREYNARPEVKEKRRLYAQEYKTTEAAKAYRREYEQRPEVRERKNAQARAVAATEEGKKRKQEYRRREYGKPEYQRRIKAYRFRKQYGITLEDYERMLDEQGGVCAICGLASPDKPLCVDHNHQSGAVRGLLCNPCNTILGRWRDSPEVAERAKQYLLKHSQLRLVS